MNENATGIQDSDIPPHLPPEIESPSSIISHLETIPDPTPHDFLDGSTRIIDTQTPGHQQRYAADRLLEIAAQASTVGEDPLPILQRVSDLIENLNPDNRSQLSVELALAYIRAGLPDKAKQVKGMTYDGKSKTDAELRLQKAAKGTDVAEEIEENNNHLRALPAELLTVAIAQKKNGHNDLAQRTIERAFACLKRDAAMKGAITVNYPFYKFAADACSEDPELLSLVLKQGMQQLESDCLIEPYSLRDNQRGPNSIADWEMGGVVDLTQQAANAGLIKEAEKMKEIVSTHYMGNRDREKEVAFCLKLIDQGIISGLIERDELSQAQEVLARYADSTDEGIEELRIKMLVKHGDIDTALHEVHRLRSAYRRRDILMPTAEQIAKDGDLEKANTVIDHIYNGSNEEDYILEQAREQKIHLLIITGQFKDALMDIKDLITTGRYGKKIEASSLLSELAVEKYRKTQSSTPAS